MPIGSAVHARTFPLCESLNYREWSGYYAVSAYEAHHEHEYNAIRNASALIDVSPLFKYRLSGRDAVRLVDRVITRDAFKLAVGQVCYTPWCDEHGKVIDDGTVTRLSEDTFRWTAADPSLRWFTQNAIGLDVAIEDISEQVAALALQGPTSGGLLGEVADADIRSLKYFRMTRGTIAGVPVDISRTGYTGDLGYEIWIEAARAPELWDALIAAGTPYGIVPAGVQALVDAERWLSYQGLAHMAEPKPGSLAVHWRGLNENAATELRGRILLGWLPIAEPTTLTVLEFDGGLELRVPEQDKTDAIHTIFEEIGPNAPAAYLGDDVTDERAFRAMQNRGLAVLVRQERRKTAARVWLKPPEELLEFLSRWREACRTTSLARTATYSR